MYISNCFLFSQQVVAMVSREFHQVSHSLHPVLSHYSVPSHLPPTAGPPPGMRIYIHSVDTSMYIHHVTSLRLWSHYGRSDGKFPHTLLMIINFFPLLWTHSTLSLADCTIHISWSGFQFVQSMPFYCTLLFTTTDSRRRHRQGCSLLLRRYGNIGSLRGSIFPLASRKTSAYILIFLTITTTCTCSPNGFDCFECSVHFLFFLFTKASSAVNVNVDINVGGLIMSRFTSCQGHICNCIIIITFCVCQKLHCGTDKTWR